MFELRYNSALRFAGRRSFSSHLCFLLSVSRSSPREHALFLTQMHASSSVAMEFRLLEEVLRRRRAVRRSQDYLISPSPLSRNIWLRVDYCSVKRIHFLQSVPSLRCWFLPQAIWDAGTPRTTWYRCMPVPSDLRSRCCVGSMISSSVSPHRTRFLNGNFNSSGNSKANSSFGDFNFHSKSSLNHSKASLSSQQFNPPRRQFQDDPTFHVYSDFILVWWRTACCPLRCSSCAWWCSWFGSCS